MPRSHILHLDCSEGQFKSVSIDETTVAQKGHTCKLKMLLQTKNFTCKLKMLLQIKNRTCKLKIVHALFTVPDAMLE